MVKLLFSFGCEVEGDWMFSIDVEGVVWGSFVVFYEFVKTMCALVIVMGFLLVCFGWTRIFLLGGCVIGVRFIDQYLKGFEVFGVDVNLEYGYIEVKMKGFWLKGVDIVFDMVIVGGTQNVMMVAILVKGGSRLENVVWEFEI